MVWHGKNICQQIGGTWNGDSGYRYLIGNYNQNLAANFLKPAAVRVIHWVGTDVLFALQGRPFYNPAGAHHLCDSENLQAELQTIGIDATVLMHRPTNAPPDVVPLTGDAICYYAPTGRPDFHHLKTVRAIEARLPDREFIHRPIAFDQPIGDVFAQCSHYLRLAEHDGFSHLAAEFVMAGREVVTNQRRPFQRYVDADDLDGIVRQLGIYHPAPCAPAAYRAMTDPAHVVAFLEGLE